MTKAELLDDLRAARAEWDELAARVGEARMAEAGAAGYWSVRDVIAHLTAVDRWFVNALEANSRGEPPPNMDEQMMELDERNRRHFEQNRHRPLHEVLAESRQVFEQLLELVQQLPEEFLLTPQTFENAPEPVVPWKTLKEACADHYRHHVPSVRAWLESSTGDR
jgi:uncharacterized protein (TIGR03083 family)